ncbi:hypothetical protein GCM10010423_67680 [Streptomyces levis]|uniref:Uncharacterized protein n=1 Tax=Streptomyces levis TaxID=285566 RepID=A0ABN3P214_9ACTN
MPSARTTPAAAVGTGQFSISVRLFNDMRASLCAPGTGSGEGSGPEHGPSPYAGPGGVLPISYRRRLLGAHSKVLALGA